MVDIDDNERGTAKGTPPARKKAPAAPAGPAVDSPVIKLVNAVKNLLGGAASPSPPSARTVAAADPVLADGAEAEASAAPDPVVAGGPLMAVVVRNQFYRDGFRTLLRIAIAEAVVIVLLILSFIAYMNAARPQNYYFATTADGRILQLVPLNLPNMGTASLMSWSAQAAAEVMTFGFHDYQRRMQQASRHFTRRGWETFTDALQKSRIIESVEAGKQVVTAQPRSAPVLVQEGVFNGKYRWVVDLPLTVNYQASGAARTDNLTLRLVIDRVPSLENPNGIGIEQWIATQ